MPTTWLDTLARQTRRFGNFPYPHQAAALLDNPFRRLLVNPDRLADGLSLTGSERVLELGPGPGFFSVEIARRLTGGQLDLFDLQPEMLDKARRKLDRAGYRNVGFHAGEASTGLPFPDSTFDVAFLAAVLGEVPDKPACMRSLGRVLKPGGRLVFVEGFPDPDRISVSELRALAEPEGFAFVSATGSWWQDIVEFNCLDKS
jgi:arsenite methyltransferase